MDPIRNWIKTDPVRRWLVNAGGSWKRNHGWKKLGIAGLILLLICIFLITTTVVLLVLLVKALSSGSPRTKDLYLPGKFVNRDLYFPRGRR